MSTFEDEPSGVFDAPGELDPVPPEDRARVVAGRYEIEESLGSGGMGQVMRVRHRRLGKAFALKLMHAELSLDREAEQLFHKEAKLASQLSHPNIVEMIDFGNDPDWGWFIVMEYLEGELLSTRIARMGKLPIAAACTVAAQLADALAHSHGKQVIHADLKPDNVLCVSGSDDGESERWEVKLLDFGTAHVASVSGLSDRVTGTPEYLAPERVTGQPPAPSSDVYALGIILYEMLCGTPPFSGDDTTTLLHRQLGEAPEPVGARRGEVLDERLDAIVQRALEKDPANRYPTAEAMRDDLRGYLDVLGFHERERSSPTLTSETGRRNEAAAAAFEALRLPVAGLRRDGYIMVANNAFARYVGAAGVEAIEGKNIRRTVIAEMNPDMHDDLRLVALNGKVIRRNLPVERDGRTLQVRYILAPAQGACGHCMLVLHST